MYSWRECGPFSAPGDLAAEAGCELTLAAAMAERRCSRPWWMTWDIVPESPSHLLLVH